MKKLTIPLSFPVFLLSFFFTACNGYGGFNNSYGPMMGGGHMYGYGGGMFTGVLWILLLVIIGIGAFYFFKNKSVGETPLDILKKRYAQGEITKEEFEKIKKDL